MTSPYLTRPTRSESQARAERIERALVKMCETLPRELECDDPVPAWKRDRHIRAHKQALEALRP